MRLRPTRTSSETILISSAGFFVDRPAALFVLFAVALLSDFVWATIGLVFRQVRNRERAKAWARENGLTGALVVAIVWVRHVYFTADTTAIQAGFCLATLVLLFNSYRSLFKFNRDLGFPSPADGEGGS